MVVYVDLVFLANLLIDGTTLLTAAWTRKLKVKMWRILAASALGALYVALLFIPALHVLYGFAAKLAVSLLMVLGAFGFGSLQHFLRNLCAFYVINFAAAGTLFGIHYLLMPRNEMLGGLMVDDSGYVSAINLGFFFLIALFMLSIWLYRLFVGQVRRRGQLTDFVAKVEVSIGDFSTSCSGLIDTGNQLTDPLTRLPVMVMELSQWEHALPKAWAERIRDTDAGEIVHLLDEEPFAWRDRIRLVPYRGVNRGTRFMLAIKPDRVVIVHQGAVSESRNVLIGLDGGRLSADGSYQAIIHPAMVEAATG